MILDSEKQRELMMTLINAAPITGPYQNIRVVVANIDELIVAVSKAQVAPKPANKQPTGSATGSE